MHIIESASLRRSADAALTEFEGRPFGSGVSFIMVSSDVPGVGPDLHQHPYPETFLIRSGRARFTVRDEHIIGVGGQIIVVPAFTPHKFEIIGPERLEMIDMHANDTFITEWLDGPRANPQESSKASGIA
ncbi:MAG TPA: cupin domain-containing protein [Roseiflexaceae bacterium]